MADKTKAYATQNTIDKTVKDIDKEINKKLSHETDLLLADVCAGDGLYGKGVQKGLQKLHPNIKFHLYLSDIAPDNNTVKRQDALTIKKFPEKYKDMPVIIVTGIPYINTDARYDIFNKLQTLADIFYCIAPRDFNPAFYKTYTNIYKFTRPDGTSMHQASIMGFVKAKCCKPNKQRYHPTPQILSVGQQHKGITKTLKYFCAIKDTVGYLENSLFSMDDILPTRRTKLIGFPTKTHLNNFVRRISEDWEEIYKLLTKNGQRPHMSRELLEEYWITTM